MDVIFIVTFIIVADVNAFFAVEAQKNSSEFGGSELFAELCGLRLLVDCQVFYLAVQVRRYKRKSGSDLCSKNRGR
mgnify:CR=1 FL=1